MHTRKNERALIGGALGVGVGVGAAAMFFFDPVRGRRRRALARDKAGRWLRLARRAAQIEAADIYHRALGTFATWRRTLRGEGPIDDDVLEERVRACAGHVAHSSHALEVHAHEGRIVLEGEVPAGDVRAILHCVRAIPGVAGIDDHLRRRGDRTNGSGHAQVRSPGEAEHAQAEQALHLGDLDSDPRSTGPALDELGIRHDPPPESEPISEE